ncbi:hypothetical protein CSC73_15205 [Pseudoxanthomonas sacheonensis]|nr:hypothetical protein CSC73_15205 [Pseudoxanthomonas sacheonensis]
MSGDLRPQTALSDHVESLVVWISLLDYLFFARPLFRRRATFSHEGRRGVSTRRTLLQIS